MEIASILITGANRGLGYELVSQFAAAKPSPDFIYAGCRNPDGADKLKELAQKHPNVKIIKIAIGDESSYQTAVQQVTQDVGDRGLTVLFNNAGILTYRSFEKVTAEEMRKEYEVDVIGPLMLTKAFYPLLKKAADNSKDKGLSCTRAAVLNMTSGIGLISDNTSGNIYPYRAAKVALNMITKSMSIDFKSDGIMAVSINPGWVQTDLGGANATLTPTECIEGIRNNVMAKMGEKENGRVVKYTGIINDY
ncbi:C-signal-like [Amphiura filiformis]|uniref:C-signal-like n=1 Tax=Amphiura filiformis TaxID=82378 RepID=UPI003B223C20